MKVEEVNLMVLNNIRPKNVLYALAVLNAQTAKSLFWQLSEKLVQPSRT